MPTTTAPLPATGPATQMAGGSYGELSPGELSGALATKDFTLINAHVPDEGEIAGTDAFIPYDRIGEDTARLPGDRAAIVLYCRTGRMSAEAATTLVRLGYRNVSHLAGGMEAWQAGGYPIQERQQR
jgi:phage shock protein E